MGRSLALSKTPYHLPQTMKDTATTTTMWSKTATKFRRKKSSSSSNKVCDTTDTDIICKNNSLPDAGGGGFAIVGKTPSADDASIMGEIIMLKEIDREYNAQHDVCKNNSSITESEMTMSNGPSASGEEERSEIVQVPSDVSDAFESDDEEECGEKELDEDVSAGEAVVDKVNGKGMTTDETPSVECSADAKPTSVVAAERNEETVQPTLYQKLERLMHERVTSINQMRKMLRYEIKLDNGESLFSLHTFTVQYVLHRTNGERPIRPQI